MLSEKLEHSPQPRHGLRLAPALVLNMTLAQPLAEEYAELLRGRDDDEPVALADPFAFASCETRDRLARS
jgi:endoglucanase